MLNKPIIINGKHKEKLTAALAEEQRRARARTLTVENIEAQLQGITAELNLSKTAMDGIEVEFTGAEKLPSAYKYTPESTHYRAVFKGGFWRITDIGRYTCPNSDYPYHIILTDKAKERIISRIEDRYDSYQRREYNDIYPGYKPGYRA